MALRGFEQLKLFGVPKLQADHLIYFFYRKGAKSAEVFAEIIFKIRLEGDFKFSLLLLSFAKEKNAASLRRGELFLTTEVWEEFTESLRE